MKEKNLELERLVFFSDAVVAIAATLLVLDLKLEKGSIHTLQFSDIIGLWEKFSAFLLSFLMIALFWLIHHEFFSHIRKVDEKLAWANIFWLLFIVILPFSASMISSYPNQVTSTFLYSSNILLITIFQNIIWDYVAVRPDYLKEETEVKLIQDTRLYCNIAILNGVVAVFLSFISPPLAFLILFTRPLMKRIADGVLSLRRKKNDKNPKHPAVSNDQKPKAKD
jgi:uncharacterized membrane protein